MTSQQDTSLEEILYDYWAKHRDCKDGCQHMNQGEDTIQALTSWKDKEVMSAWSDGYHKGWKARKQTTSEGDNGQTKSS